MIRLPEDITFHFIIFILGKCARFDTKLVTNWPTKKGSYGKSQEKGPTFEDP